MPQTLTAAALTLLVALLWALGRPRPRLIRSVDGRAVAALNQAQIVLVPAAAALNGSSHQSTRAEMSPLSLGVGRERQRQLWDWRAALRADRTDRVEIVNAAAASGDAAVLPLLRLALRDVDPQVVGIAAQALDTFRRRPRTVRMAVRPPRAQAPRNVARTR